MVLYDTKSCMVLYYTIFNINIYINVNINIYINVNINVNIHVLYMKQGDWTCFILSKLSPDG